jgi:hypothetical protein
MNKPASPDLLSETAIVARMAEATLGSARPDWRPTATTTPHPRRYRKGVRRLLRLQRRVAKPGGFHLKVASREREWITGSGKAQFVPQKIELDPRARAKHGERLMVLMTTRSHDQYNTTIYAWTTAIAACSACAAWSSSTRPTSTCWA